MIANVATTELGVARALTAALGGKSAGKIQSFDEASRMRRRENRLPAWQRAFEKVNSDRVIQTG